MALTNDAVFPQKARSKYTQTTLAGGAGTPTTANVRVLFSADADNGSVITSITATPMETANANVLSIYSTSNLSSVGSIIRQEVAPAQTVSTTAKATPIDFGISISNPLYLRPGEHLLCVQAIANPTSGYVWQARGRDM